ncbi:hypothetical protein ACFR99_01025 [Haloarchaeobius amylolyticus]|uniref:VOC family protein n=1 Tax=Haloarchaeobius amylolyticus TaxID=1198296 RepID=A0ABD6BB18_9EURY
MPVPDIDAALDWYEGVLDFQRLLGPVEVDGDEDSQMAELCRDVLGEFDTVRIAHTATGNSSTSLLSTQISASSPLRSRMREATIIRTSGISFRIKSTG